MSFESSSEDPMDYLRTKDSEKEPLLGGKVAAAPPGKYMLECMFIDILLQSIDISLQSMDAGWFNWTAFIS